MTTSQGSGDLVDVGRITGAHGIRGEVKVLSLTDFPERFYPETELLMVTVAGQMRPVTVLTCREHKGHYLLHLDGISDRTAAEACRGSYLKIREGDLKSLPDGRYYHFQILGLEVVTDDGRGLGKVEEVLPTGGNLVLVVKGTEGEVLLPFIDDVVLQVDLEAGRIKVHLLEGLLPDEKKSGSSQ
jgi:16S rRNA processing protein RimM